MIEGVVYISYASPRSPKISEDAEIQGSLQITCFY